MELADRSVPAHDPLLEGYRLPPLERGLGRFADALAAVRMDALEVPLEGGPELARRKPVDAVQLVGPGDSVLRDLPLPEAEVRHRFGLGPHGGVASRFFFRPMPFGDVVEEDGQAA